MSIRLIKSPRNERKPALLEREMLAGIAEVREGIEGYFDYFDGSGGSSHFTKHPTVLVVTHSQPLHAGTPASLL